MTNLASTNVLEHKLILAGPVNVTINRNLRLFPTTMPTCRGIVTLFHDAQAQLVMSGDEDARRVAGNGCIVQQPVAISIPIR